MPDILAIVSKAVFERDARIDGRTLEPGDVWPVDRYNSANKALQSLADGGRIFLVTVRPPNEQLWFVGVVDAPAFDGSAWVSDSENELPVTNITPLRKTIVFESGKGITQDKGTLGMSLQTPRALATTDVTQIMEAVAAGGAAPRRDTLPAAVERRPARSKPRVIAGKYEIVRELGKGGMGVVYEARHTGTGRRVALKEMLSSELGADPKIVERFYREARATGAIETQHVTPVLDTGSDPVTKNPYLVMELLAGRDLQSRLDDSGPFTQDVALRIVAQACTGLARAHAAGVIHRDIKPANLFLARRDDEGDIVVKLLDFGVARVKEQLAATADGGIHRALTSTGVMLGTPLYMSPEQVMGQKDLDHRSDLWSLGVVMYELLSGVTPHDEVETMGALLVSICSRPARPIRELSPHVSARVEAIVQRTLAIDRGQRYATADELLADLKRELPAGTRLDDAMLAAP